MILFLLKGLVRDRSRSLFPVLTVVAGVALTVTLYSWVKGTETDLIQASAAFSTGHVRVVPRGAAREADAPASDLALDGLSALVEELRGAHPALTWTPRIRFAGLLDLPDANGETRAQAPVTGLAIDLVAAASPERGLLNIDRALRRGRLPQQADEILVSDALFDRLGIRPGDTATLIATTRFGSLTTANLRVVGAVRFGVSAIDRGAVVADLRAIQRALDMEDAATEVLGFYADRIYRDGPARVVAAAFNERAGRAGDARATGGHVVDGDAVPVMSALRDQAGLASTLDLARLVTRTLIGVFVVVMSIVLWNAGLMASLRRYGEVGVRLAIGERKGHVYGTLVAESMMVGIVGSIAGTLLGLGISYYLQVRGLDISAFLKNASMLISDVLRAEVTPVSWVIGFVPGLLATFLGTSISGIGVYRRQTAQLMKELEA